ncbi:MAG: hypothetical protein KAT34_20150 [Candidatus Aminicenantes bacterium]|nr:hypothetical protein [Candidatus Aminicenantes bacterium]
MHPKTAQLREKIRDAASAAEKVNLLQGAYEGETCYLLTCGPSFKDNWSDEVKELLSDKLVVSVKQTYNEAAEIADFHLLNSWNYQPYDYKEPAPIVLFERADDDPPTPGTRPDLLFRIPDPRNFSKRLATTLAFDDWLFSKGLERPWGPGVVYELGIYLFVHLGVKEIIAMGWDLGELNVPVMTHYFKEEAPGSRKPDGILNKPRIRPFEVQDIAESTRALYYWFRSKGIYLYIVSDRSLIDPVVPRVSIFSDTKKLAKYTTELICNGNFSTWNRNMPLYWETNADTRLISRSEKTPDGTSGVELKPAGRKKYNSIFQFLKSETFFQGGRFKATARVKAYEPGKLSFSTACLRDSRDREPVMFKTDHPGDGQWQDLEISGTIPVDIPVSHLKFTVMLRAGAKEPALIKEVNVTFEK